MSEFEEQFPGLIEEIKKSECDYDYFKHQKHLFPDDVQKHCLDKGRVREELEKSKAYHKDQQEVNEPWPRIAHHHEIIIDFIDNELKERFGL